MMDMARGCGVFVVTASAEIVGGLTWLRANAAAPLERVAALAARAGVRPVQAIVRRVFFCFCPPMRLPSSSVPTALRPSSARAAHGLVRWLVLLLLVFDQFSAPWHTHHHSSGVDGTAVAAVHADGLEAEVRAEMRAEAPDHRSSWAHATTALRDEAGPCLTWAGDDDAGHGSFWPAARLTEAAQASTRLGVASHQEPPTSAQRSLRPSPRAPPWRV